MLGWNNSLRITINHTKVGGVLAEYPLYIDLSLLPEVFWLNVKEKGGDIRITDSDGVTECPREIVFCDIDTKKGEVHTLLSSISSSVDTIVYIYFGNSTAEDYLPTDPYGRNAVWGNNSLVYHLKEYISGSNLILNPSFDVNLDNYFQYVNGGESLPPTLTRDTSEFYSSPASLKHVGSGVSTYSGVRIRPTCVIGKNYLIKLKTKAILGGNFNIFAEVTGNPQKTFAQTGEWTEFSLNFTATTATPNIYFRTADDNGIFYIDDISLYEIIITDSSGQYNGTKNGGVNAPIEANAKIEKGQQFDGVSNYGMINIDRLSVDVAQPHAFVAWVNLSGAPDLNWNGVIDKFQMNTGVFSAGTRLSIAINRTVTFSTGTSMTGNRQQDLATDSALSIGQYYYVAGIYDGTNIKVLVNKTLKSVVATYPPVNRVETDVRIGNSHHSDGTLNGIVDEARIYKFAPSIERLNTEYENQNDPASFYSISDRQAIVGFRNPITIRINHSKVGGVLTNYPLYIDLSLLEDNFWNFVKNGGGDIRILTAEGTECPREIVSCDTTAKTGEVHALIPNVSDTVDTDIYIYFGNPNAEDYLPTDIYGRNAVWGDYIGVWHLNNDGSIKSDSTGVNDGVAIGTMSVIDGKKGKATRFDATKTGKIFIADASGITNFDTQDNYSISFWARRWKNTILSDRSISEHWESATGLNPYPFSMRGFTSSASINMAVYNGGDTGPSGITYNPASPSTGAVMENVWKKITFVKDYSNKKLKTYVDATSIGLGNNFTVPDIDSTKSKNNGFVIGERISTGTTRTPNLDIQEYRIIKLVQSNNLLTTEYNNQNDPSSFYAIINKQTITGISTISSVKTIIL